MKSRRATLRHDILSTSSLPSARIGGSERIVILLCFQLPTDISRGAAQTAKLDALIKAKKKKSTCDGHTGRQASRQAGRQADRRGRRKRKEMKREKVRYNIVLHFGAYLIRRVKSCLIARAGKNSSRAQRRSALQL